MRPFGRILFALVWVFASAVPTGAREWASIRIGVEGSYPPFNYVDGNSQLQGFDIDIAHALCATIGARCSFVRQDWDDIIPALLAHRYDAIISSMSITAERSKLVSFTKTYHRSPGAFVVLDRSPVTEVSPLTMKGRVVAAQTNTIYERYLKANYATAGVSVKIYHTQQEAELDLLRGGIDALLAGKVSLLRWTETTEEGRRCRVVKPDIKSLGNGAGIAVRKEDDDLREKFDAALAAILANGTYKRINDKYFQFSIY